MKSLQAFSDWWLPLIMPCVLLFAFIAFVSFLFMAIIRVWVEAEGTGIVGKIVASIFTLFVVLMATIVLPMLLLMINDIF